MTERMMTSDPAVTTAARLAAEQGVETVFDRFRAQQPQCGFGSLGLCCRVCWKGPCRIDPFGAGPQKGICGADRHTIAARQLTRMMAAGAAAHADHGRHILYALQKLISGEAEALSIRDSGKLLATATRLGIETKDRAIMDVAQDIVDASFEDFSNQDLSKTPNWLAALLPDKRIEKLRAVGVLPPNIDMGVAQLMSRTSIGCDADPLNIILGGVRAALCDLNGMALATELSDIVFGTPAPVVTQADLGVLDQAAVNIAMNGHNPLVSEAICAMAVQMDDEAREAGATEGINLVGVCCTGNEVMLRHGVPLAANYLSQEMVMVTGALDAMVVDVQCIMPGIVAVAEHYHTVVVTTHDENKIPGAVHRSVHPENANVAAREIIGMAIDAYKRRDPKLVNIPDVKQTAIVGFSAEAILEVLTVLDAEDPLKPLVDSVVSGAIQGIVLFAGCNTTQVDQDANYKIMARELARRNVLLLATGCGGGALAKDGLMTQEATEQYAGDGLKSVLTALGNAAGLNGPLPPVWHMGSCVDNSRAITVATALADKLGVDFSDLPIVASAPECMSEKAVSIGTWAAALGFPVHLGNTPQIMGSDQVVSILTEGAKDVFGGYFIVETDPIKASEKVFEAIQERRRGLGL